MISFWLPFFLSFISFALAQETQAIPSDPFYDYPPFLENYKHGEIIRRRTIQQNFWVDANISEIVQVAYKTRLTEGGDSWSIATILKPANPDPNKKLYSYQAFEDAVQLDCAPSWTLKNGLFSPGISAVFNNLTGTVGSQVREGRYVVIPDHEGYESAFFGGRQEGYAGLDGVRAALHELNATASETPVVFYGYSGGAHATAWMVNLQEEYAPELNVVGAAYGGVLVDALKELEWVDQVNVTAKGSVAALLAGLLIAYPDVNATLWPHMNSFLQKTMVQLRTIPNFCSSEFLLSDYTDTIRSNINVDIDTWPPTLKMFKHESLLSNFSSTPVSVPKFPRYIYQGSSDEIAPYYLVESYIQQQKSGGGNIDFVTWPGLGHIETAFQGLGAAMDWVDKIFDNSD